MTITSQRKILHILLLIVENSELTAPGKPILIHETNLNEREIPLDEFVSILDKLTADEFVTAETHEVTQPDGVLAHRYEISIKNNETFKSYTEKLHVLVNSDIEVLKMENLLAIADVTFDIYRELQMISDSAVEIPVVPQVTRFPILLPAVTPSLMDKYGDSRMSAFYYLEEREVISDIKVNNVGHKWESTISILVERIKFQLFYNRLLSIYNLRTKPEELQQAQKEALITCTPRFHFKDGAFFRDHSPHIIIIQSEDSLEFKLLNAALLLPVGERLDGISDLLEMHGRQVPDTARALNKKIEEIFGVPSFFETDYPNKSARRLVE